MDESRIKVIRSGMETIKGGVRCICSPGGWFAGNTSAGHCACGCFGTATPAANWDANTKMATT